MMDPLGAVLDSFRRKFPDAPATEVFFIEGMHRTTGLWAVYEYSLRGQVGVVTIDDLLPIRMAVEVLAHELAHAALASSGEFDHPEEFWTVRNVLLNDYAATYLVDRERARCELHEGYSLHDAGDLTWPEPKWVIEWCEANGVKEAN